MTNLVNKDTYMYRHKNTEVWNILGGASYGAYTVIGSIFACQPKFDFYPMDKRANAKRRDT